MFACFTFVSSVMNWIYSKQLVLLKNNKTIFFFRFYIFQIIFNGIILFLLFALFGNYFQFINNFFWLILTIPLPLCDKLECYANPPIFVARAQCNEIFYCCKTVVIYVCLK